MKFLITVMLVMVQTLSLKVAKRLHSYAVWPSVSLSLQRRGSYIFSMCLELGIAHEITA